MKYLILGSGGMIAYKFIGVLKYLKDSESLDDVEEISGASSGAILAAFFVLFKGDVEKMLNIMLEMDVKNYAKKNIKNFLKKYGLIDSLNIKKMVDDCGLKDITFRELYEINPIKVHIPTFDIENNRTVYLSVDNNPDMDVSTAIMYSVSVPILFTPVEGRFVDGSTAEWSPGAPFLGKSDVFELRADIFTAPKQHKSLVDYLIILFKCILSTRIRYDDFKRIDLSADFDIFDFSMSREMRIDLYKSGYAQVVGMYSH